MLTIGAAQSPGHVLFSQTVILCMGTSNLGFLLLYWPQVL